MHDTIKHVVFVICYMYYVKCTYIVMGQRKEIVECVVMGVSEVEQSNLKGLFCYCVIAV